MTRVCLGAVPHHRKVEASHEILAVGEVRSIREPQDVVHRLPVMEDVHPGDRVGPFGVLALDGRAGVFPADNVPLDAVRALERTGPQGPGQEARPAPGSVLETEAELLPQVADQLQHAVFLKAGLGCLEDHGR